jgi:hypothetical protein
MRFSKIILSILILSIFLTLFITSESNAIPAFARRYKISCTTCHAPIPKLKPYGDEFAGNGFIMKENEKARDYVSAGDDLLWLNKDFPVGVRFDAYAVYDEDKPVDKDLQIPWGVKILSGGTLYKNIGYYFYFYFSERGEVAGIEDAYVHFDNIFGSNLDIMAGQFQTSDPLMKRELRLTFEDYMIYKQRFGLSRTNLAYDRGLIFVYGVEKTGTDLIAMVVNGNGKAEAGFDKKFDDDPFKNFGLRINQGIGDIASIGGYFYKGREKFVYSDGILGTFENELTYVGPDFNVGIGPIEFTFQYLIRKDTNPMFLSQSEEYKSKGTIAEIIYSPRLDKSRFFLTGLYNKIDSDLYKYETATLSGTYLIARNLRLIAEFTRDLEYDLNRFTLGMVSGF